MYILAIETTGAYASVALLEAEKVDESRESVTSAGSGMMNPMIALKPEEESRFEAEERPDAEGRPEAEERPDAERRSEAERRPDAEGRSEAEERPDAEGRPDAERRSEAEGNPEAGSWPEAEERSGEKGARILRVIHGNDRFSHLQNLTPQIRRILKESELSIGDINAIAVSHGPGSFTGIRIGVSTARALAQVLDIPCIPVSSLEALALRARESGLICPALDARRKQVYAAAYEWVEGELICRIPPASLLMTDFLQRLDQLESASPQAQASEGGSPVEGDGIVFIGDGIDTCGEIIRQWAQASGRSLQEDAEESGEHPGKAGSSEESPGTGKEDSPGAQTSRPLSDPAGGEGGRVVFAPRTIRYQDASTVALRGLQLYRQGKTCQYMQLQPEYLRMAEAEKKLRDKLAAQDSEKPAEAERAAAQDSEKPAEAERAAARENEKPAEAEGAEKGKAPAFAGGAKS